MTEEKKVGRPRGSKNKTKAPGTGTARTVNRKAKVESPQAGASRATGRPGRGRQIGQFRDILNVDHKDPNYQYRWVLSAADMDKRIYDAIAAGWEFVDATKEPSLVVGSYAVGQVASFGAVFRVPASRRMKDEYVFLMKMPKELFEETLDWKASLADERENDVFREMRPEDDREKGQYSIQQEIGWEERHRRA